MELVYNLQIGMEWDFNETYQIISGFETMKDETRKKY